MASVAVGEWMDEHQPVMKPQRQFNGRISAVFGPELRIIEQQTQLRGNLNGVNTDILLGFAESACPFPPLPEQVFMQAAREAFGKGDDRFLFF